MYYSLWMRVVAGLLTAVTASLLLMAGCAPKSPPPSQPVSNPPTAVTPTVANEFVGNAECRSCHPAEFQAHQASRHAHTLRIADRESLGKLAPSAGKIPGTDIVLKEKDGGFRMTIAGEEGESMPLDLAFGSGKTGMTYVSLMDTELFEMRKSYFPPQKSWYLTPGHEKQKPTDVGMMYVNRQARECLLCHAVTLSGSRLKPEKRFFGVGCESCHGPGGAHVTAMKAGKMEALYMDRLGQGDATHQIQACAKCHRGPQAVNPQGPQGDMTNRFQPYGLMKSRCFLESKNTLSCLTCHDPHTDAGTDHITYEATCRKCHSKTPAPTRAGTPLISGSVCPVNAKSGCVTCHMPQKPVFKENALPAKMADHYIRVFKK